MSTATINREFQGSTIETVIPLDEITNFAEMVQMAVLQSAANAGITLSTSDDLAAVLARTADTDDVIFTYYGNPRSSTQIFSSMSPAIKSAALMPTQTGYAPVDMTIQTLVNTLVFDASIPFNIRVSIAKLAVSFYIEEVNNFVADKENDVVMRIRQGANPVTLINAIPQVVLAGWSNNVYTFAVSRSFPSYIMNSNWQRYYDAEDMSDDEEMGESEEEETSMSASPTPSVESSMETSTESIPNTSNMIKYTYTVNNNRITILTPVGTNFIDYLKTVKMLLKETAEDNEIELDSVDHVIESARNVDEPDETLIGDLPDELIEGIGNYDPATDPNAAVISGIVAQGYFNPPLVSLSFATPIGEGAKIPLATLIVRSWGYHARIRNGSDIVSIIRSIVENRSTVQRAIADTRRSSVSLISAALDVNGMNDFTFNVAGRAIRSSTPSPVPSSSSSMTSSAASSSSSDDSIPEELRAPDPSTIIPLDQDVKDPLDPDSPPFDLSTVTLFPTLQDLIRTMRSIPSDTPINVAEVFTPCDYTDLDPVMYEPYSKSERGSFVVFMIPSGEGGYKASCISIDAFPVPPSYNPATGRMSDDTRDTNYFANWVLKKYNTNINRGNGDEGRPGTRRFSKIPIPFSLYMESHVFDYIKTRSDDAIRRRLLPIFWLQALPPIRLGRASNTAGNPFVGELHGQDPLETPYGIVAFGELPFENMPQPDDGTTQV